ncbi:DHHC palmitoyltransferase-domain-containing protein [Gorgonomyces haynaldii]|nr:DHHC palmitoyltransferase-domain-containing protein [Gorgonomyces haynaldii]
MDAFVRSNGLQHPYNAAQTIAVFYTLASPLTVGLLYLPFIQPVEGATAIALILFLIWMVLVIGGILLMKHPDALHCKYCNKCIRRLDHHCFYVNNCIGYYNYRSYLVTMIGGCLYSLGHTIMISFYSFSLQGYQAAYMHNMTTLQYSKAKRAKAEQKNIPMQDLKTVETSK